MGNVNTAPIIASLLMLFDTEGGEVFQIKVRDIHHAIDLKDTLHQTQGEFVWSENSDALIYTALNEYHRPDRVLLHQLGDDPSKDLELYRETDASFFISLYKTRSKNFIAIHLHSHTTSEIYLLDAKQPQRQAKLLVQARKEGLEYRVEDRKGILYILNNDGDCKNFKLSTIPLADIKPNTSVACWKDFYRPPNQQLLEDFIVAQDFVAVLEISNAQANILVMHGARLVQHYKLDFDEAIRHLSFEQHADYHSPWFRFRYSSLRLPARIYDYNTVTRQASLIKEYKPASPYQSDNYRSERLWCKAQDGSDIPISVLYHKDTPLDGSAPLLLYGYGAYGSSVPTSFSSNRLSLVERGFIYAIAHVRGGMEKGYAWYRAGKLANKKNTFTDFIAAAKHLAAQKYTCSGNISIHGGSAGGMLIGAVLNMQPQFFRSAVAEVPFVDVLNTMCDDSLPLTPPEWSEWGNPCTDAQAYANIASYSPYDNIRQQNYPAILATAGLSDPRVTYWEPAKWVAKLRDHKQNDEAVLLKTNMHCGHAGAAGRFDYLEELAFIYAFILRAHKIQ